MAQLTARALPLPYPILRVSYMRLTEILTITSGDFTGVYKTNNKLVRSCNEHRSYRRDVGDLTVSVSDVNSLKSAIVRLHSLALPRHTVKGVDSWASYSNNNNNNNNKP
jgi:hypothetical protein